MQDGNPAKGEKASLRLLQCCGNIGISQQEADRSLVFHHEFDQVRVGEPEHLVGQSFYLLVSDGRTTAGPFQRTVVEGFQVAEGGSQFAARLETGDMQATSLLDADCQFVDSLRELDIFSQIAGNDLACLLKTQGLDQFQIIRRIIRLSQCWTPLEAFDQQSQSI